MYKAHRIHNHHKVIHFVRHAEGHHNVAGKADYRGYLREDLVDAEITPLGIQQCEELRDKVQEKLKSVELLIVSPMNRTIQTALYSFPHLKDSIPWIAIEHIREQTGRHPCDRRTPIRDQRQRYSFINYDHIESDDDIIYHRYDPNREPAEDVVERAKIFLDWLRNREEKEIVVVTHSAFLRHLFRHLLSVENMDDSIEFENCELRTFVLNLDPIPSANETEN